MTNSTTATLTRPSVAGLAPILDRQRQAFRREGPPSASRRRDGLRRLRKALITRLNEMAAAISRDFGHRSPHETLMADLFTTVEGIDFLIRHLGSWMRPERRKVALHFLPGRAEVVSQPLGVVGIIAPWNYPINLAVAPLAAAYAAGNRVMLKPSEYTPATSGFLADVLAQVFGPDEVAVVIGGPDVSEAFARLPFDHLFFTGSTSVGRAVMRAASENLVPVTLELGGKSPVLIDADYPLERAVRSVVHGKLFNAGQTCIAPDYVLLPEAAAPGFVSLFEEQVRRLYPRLLDNPDYCSVVNQRHYDRLEALVDDARAKGADVVEINPANEEFRSQLAHKLPPTLISRVTDEMKVMQDEIFGPVLPIRTYRSLEEAIAYINERPRPLALYYFGNQQDRRQAVISGTTSGGVTVNDVFLHYLQEDLPFGGVGGSGMGAYHGREGFRTFSHRKAVFDQSRINTGDLLRPPYGKRVERIIKLLLR